jgi:hypothetical protein
VNTRIAQKQSQLATFTMRAPMSAFASFEFAISADSTMVSIVSAPALFAVSAPLPMSPMSPMAISTPVTCAFGHVFGTNVAVAEAAGANTTYVAGLACTPSAAKKHDRKNNWQQRPLSLCGRSG